MSAGEFLAYLNEPGGANAVLPLLAELRPAGLRCRVVAGRHAAGLARADEESEEAAFFAGPPELGRARFVLTGCSFPPEREIALWREAGRIGIRAVGVLDQWMLYRERFTPDGGGELALPDLIAVPDAFAAREMAALGFPEERLFVYGVPYLSGIRPRPPVPPPASLDRPVRVLFAAEPRGLGVPLGYDEFSTLRHLLAALEEAPARHGFDLLVRPHPRHEPGAFAAFGRGTARVRVSVGREGPVRQALAGSDLVAGMSSMALLEAVLLGVPTVSVQIGLARPDPFVLSRMGLLPSALDRDALRAALSAALAGAACAWRPPAPRVRELAGLLLAGR